MTRINLMGCSVDSYNMQETINKIEEYIQRNGYCQHVVVNVSKFVEMQTDFDLKRIISKCQIINADGMPLVWASKILGNPLPCRVAGVDLFQELVAICEIKGYKPYFFGATQWVVEKMVDTFIKKYPGLKVAGFKNGYYDRPEEPEIAEMIRKSNADMLFVGFSSPMKENFLNNWMQKMQVPFCMGVGGSFDVIAGKTKRAPVWMQNIGMEWFFRIIQEPKRMWKRYAKTNPIFVWMVLKELIRRDIHKLTQKHIG